MNFLKKEQNIYVLIALMSAFVLFKINIPESLASVVDTLYGRLLVIAGAVSLIFAHPVLGSVALIAAYELINRSERKTGSYQMKKYLPSELNKSKMLEAYNQFPKTLEEEMVEKMIPLTQNHNLGPAEYKPTLEQLHDAARL